MAGDVTDVATTEAVPQRGEIATWLAAVRSELLRIAGAIEPLLTEQSRLRSREALLLKLLESFEDAPRQVETGGPATVSGTPPEPETSIRDYVRLGVTEVLRESGGGPMHINDIHKKFVARGLRVPGAGRPANLTAHLGRCEGIITPSRGFYTLHQADVPNRRRRRAKRR
jgi:hypothetical protein